METETPNFATPAIVAISAAIILAVTIVVRVTVSGVVVPAAVVAMVLALLALLVLILLLILGLLRSNHYSVLSVLPIRYHLICLHHSLRFQRVQIDPQQGLKDLYRYRSYQSADQLHHRMLLLP